MSKTKFFTLLLIGIIFLSACQPGADSADISVNGAGGSEMEAAPTQTPTPTAAAPIDTRETTADLHYFLDISDEFINVTTDETFKLFIFFDHNDPEAEALIAGTGHSTQVTQMAGMYAGNVCWVIMENNVTYDIAGLFNPADCTITLNITTQLNSSQVTADGCAGASAATDPALFFIPPPIGPHVFTESPQTLDLSQDTRSTITLTLENVFIPSTSGCSWFE